MYIYFLFDLDGTLTDPKEGITRCIQYALTKFGIDEPDLDSLTKFIGPPLGPSFSKYYGLSAQQAEDAVRYFRERYKPIGIFENAVYVGVPAMLKDLKDHGRIVALATAKPQVFAEQILDHFGIREYFDCIVGSEMDGRRTDKGAVIETVLTQLQVEDRSQAIMVGDRHHDVDGAAACGIDCVGLYEGYAEPGELEQAGAKYIVEDIFELHQLLLHI